MMQQSAADSADRKNWTGHNTALTENIQKSFHFFLFAFWGPLVSAAP
jgi:hypothetical protein